MLCVCKHTTSIIIKCVLLFFLHLFYLSLLQYIYIHIYCFIRHGFDLDRSMFVKPKSAYVSPEKRLKKSKHFMRERKKRRKTREREKKDGTKSVCWRTYISIVHRHHQRLLCREREREKDHRIFRKCVAHSIRNHLDMYLCHEYKMHCEYCSWEYSVNLWYCFENGIMTNLHCLRFYFYVYSFFFSALLRNGDYSTADFLFELTKWPCKVFEKFHVHRFLLVWFDFLLAHFSASLLFINPLSESTLFPSPFFIHPIFYLSLSPKLHFSHLCIRNPLFYAWKIFRFNWIQLLFLLIFVSISIIWRQISQTHFNETIAVAETHTQKQQHKAFSRFCNGLWVYLPAKYAIATGFLTSYAR